MRKLYLLTCIFFLILLILSQTAYSQQVSEWRGHERSGIYTEEGLLKQWPETGPELLFETTGIGKGYSSPVIDDDFIFITGMTDKMEYLHKISKQGEILWSVKYGRGWDGSFPDSRCAPSIENGRAYLSSGLGDLACIETENGNIIWKTNVFEKFDGKWGSWGISESLLLVDDKVVFTCGGPNTAMVALNKNTGETVWKTKSINDTVAYTSPRLINFGGKKIILNVLEYNLIGVNAEDGIILWTVNYALTDSKECFEVGSWAPKINTNTPLYHNGEIYITSGYNHVGAMYKLLANGDSIALKWTDHTLDVHHGGVILVDGFIYGANWLNNGMGNWCCIRWDDGKTMWEQEWNCKGSIISADGMMYLYDEKKGNLGLVKVDPEKFELVSSFRIAKGSGPYWAHPVIHDKVLYIRHGEVLMGFNIAQ